MRLCAAAPFALLALLLGSRLSPVHGVLEALNTNLKCRCVKETARFIYPQLIDRVRIVAPGNGCPNTEIIIWTKSKTTVCVKPQAKWAQKLIKYIQSKSTPPTALAPVVKKIA